MAKYINRCSAFRLNIFIYDCNQILFSLSLQSIMKTLLIVALILANSYFSILTNSYLISFRKGLNMDNFRLISSDPQYSLHLAINGMFNQNMMPKSDVIYECTTFQIATHIFNFVTYFFQRSKDGSIYELTELATTQSFQFYGSLPEETKNCFRESMQLHHLKLIYGVDNKMTKEDFEKKVGSYFKVHYLTAHRNLQQLNFMWVSEKYFECGFYSGLYLHPVFY